MSSARSFSGSGSDGTVGANKESIKIIGENTDHFAQGYFVYDSKKAGATTISHLRFGPQPIRSTYLITKANFVACHQPFLLETLRRFAGPRQGRDVPAQHARSSARKSGNIFPHEAQNRLIEQRARFFVIDANKVARDCGMGGRINTVMQTCFFAISGVLPPEQAIDRDQGFDSQRATAKKAKKSSRRTCRRSIKRSPICTKWKCRDTPAATAQADNGHLANAPAFVRNVLGEIIAGRGDRVPVSALPNDGTFPTGTARWEKRNLAAEIPVWDPEVCIQCGKCVLVCPHAVIRSKVYRAGRTRRRAPIVQVYRSASAGMERAQLHPASGGRGLHRLRHLRGRLPGPEQVRGAAQSDQHAAAVAACGRRSARTGISSSPCRNWIASKFRPRTCARCKCNSRSSSSRERAPVAAKRPTSNCSRSCSAIGSLSRMRPVARRSTAAIYRPRPTRRMAMGAAQPGRIRSSKTTPSSVWGSAFRSTSSRNSPGNCSTIFRPRSDADSRLKS